MDKAENVSEMEPTMGCFKGREHHYPLRVFYEDTDFTGIVYYANYLRFFERARSSYYKKPARVDDHLTIVTTYDKFKGARLWVSQACYRGDELLVTAISEAACITPDGRPKRAPKWMIERLKPYLLK